MKFYINLILVFNTYLFGVVPTFQEQKIYNNFLQLSESALDGADLDRDGDIDFFILGEDDSVTAFSKIYLNAGDGNFYEDKSNNFPNFIKGSVSIGDLDKDGDNDILLTGKVNTSYESKIFLNSGNGTFIENTNNSLEGVYKSNSAISDLNLDGLSDIIIMGSNSSESPISKIYLNSGNSIFTENISANIKNLTEGSLSIEDINFDSYPDILISGSNSENYTKLYINEQNNSFKENSLSSFENVYRGSTAIEDFDNDTYKDILITGTNSTSNKISKLYTNEKNGSFLKNIHTNFEGVNYSSLATEDFNSDGYKDIFITGDNNLTVTISKLYINEKNGSFIENKLTNFTPISTASSLAKDFNSDGTFDLLVSGYDNSLESKTELYLNDNNGSFTKLKSNELDINLSIEKIYIEDLNLDLKDDILTLSDLSNPILKIYTNKNEKFFFNEEKLSGVKYGSLLVDDLNGDRKSDILLSGEDNTSVLTTKLYLNSNGSFIENFSHNLMALKFGSIVSADFDNDGDRDVILTGIDASSTAKFKIYKNSGNGVFSNINSLEGIKNSSIILDDFDNDSDIDIAVVGENNISTPVAKVYENRGSFNFIESQSLDAPLFGDIKSIDFNKDGLKDIVLSGNFSGTNYIYLCKNMGKNSFVLDQSLIAENNISISISDFNGDSFEDIFVNSNISNATYIYLNNKNSTFSKVYPFNSISVVSKVGDFNGDRKSDLILIQDKNLTFHLNQTTFPDSDGDGVLDIDDKCINEYALTNDGCLEEVIEDTKINIVFPSISNSGGSIKVPVTTVKSDSLLNIKTPFNEIEIELPEDENLSEDNITVEMITISIFYENITTEIVYPSSATLSVEPSGTIQITLLNRDKLFQIFAKESGELTLIKKDNSKEEKIYIPAGSNTQMQESGELISNQILFNLNLNTNLSLNRNSTFQANLKSNTCFLTSKDGSFNIEFKLIEIENKNRIDTMLYSGVESKFKIKNSFNLNEKIKIVPATQWQQFIEREYFDGRKTITLVLGDANFLYKNKYLAMTKNIEYEIDLGETNSSEEFEMNIYKGWNLIASPVNKPININKKFPQIEKKFRYLNGQWIDNFTKVEQGIGFWIKSNIDKKIIFEGESYKLNYLPYNSNWNFLGAGENIENLSKYNLVLKFDTKSNSWIINPSEIKRGEGFLVK